MLRLLQRGAAGIGAKLTLGFGALVCLTLVVVALAIVAGREATLDIELYRIGSAGAKAVSPKKYRNPVPGHP